MNTLLRTAIVGTALLATPFAAFADTEAVTQSGPYQFLVHTKALLLTQVHIHKKLNLLQVWLLSVGEITAKVDETGTVGDLYLDTSISSIDLRLGKVDGEMGMKASTTIANVTVSAYSPSGANKSTEIGLSTDVGPLSIAGEDVLDSDRLLSAGMNVAGVDLGGSYQKTATGTNQIMDAGLDIMDITVSVANASVGDASVTKTGDNKHALLGTMTGATNGTDVRGLKVAYGDLSAKVVELNATNTYTVALKRGIMTYSYDKVENGADEVSVGVKLTF